jgi:hypothetical protein
MLIIFNHAAFCVVIIILRYLVHQTLTALHCPRYLNQVKPLRKALKSLLGGLLMR